MAAPPFASSALRRANSPPVDVLIKQSDATLQPQEVLATISVVMGRPAPQFFRWRPAIRRYWMPRNERDWHCRFSCRSGICATCRARITEARCDDAQHCVGAVGNRFGFRAVLPGPAHHATLENQLRP